MAGYLYCSLVKLIRANRLISRVVNGMRKRKRKLPRGDLAFIFEEDEGNTSPRRSMEESSQVAPRGSRGRKHPAMMQIYGPSSLAVSRRRGDRRQIQPLRAIKQWKLSGGIWQSDINWADGWSGPTRAEAGFRLNRLNTRSSGMFDRIEWMKAISGKNEAWFAFHPGARH